MQPKKLEQYKYFQPIAWTLCLGFAGYVGSIALKADDQLKKLENSSLTFEQRLERVEKAVGATSTQP